MLKAIGHVDPLPAALDLFPDLAEIDLREKVEGRLLFRALRPGLITELRPATEPASRLVPIGAAEARLSRNDECGKIECH